MATRGLTAAIVLCAAAAAGDEPPVIDHQPSPCSVPGKRVALCATVTDERQVASVRAYFKGRGETFYSFVDMAFDGLSYCATLPAPRPKTAAVEYYVQAIDDQYQAQRTSTHVMPIQPEGACEFPPLAKAREATAVLEVHATHRKQGRKLSRAFDDTAVSYLPATGAGP